MTKPGQKQAVAAIAIASLTLMLACSPKLNETSEGSASGSSLDAALATISRDNIQSILNYLADDERQGRLTGTKGYDESARYVAEQFNAIGLEKGGTDGWYQHVPFITRMIETENSGVTLHKSSGDVDLKWKKDVIIIADKLRADNRIRAEVVFVGFGVHAPGLGYSDYNEIDVSGKIVAIFKGAPATFPPTERAHFSHNRTKTEEMIRRGAIGQLVLLNRLEEKRSSWEKRTRNIGTQPGMSWIDVSGDVADFHPEHQGLALLNRHAAEQLFEDSPLTFDEALDAAGDARQLSMALGVEVTMHRKARHERISSANVVGILRGSDQELSNEYVVYTSHLDHLGTGTPIDGDEIYNGMYDNALGVAMLVETARALAALSKPPRRSIIFVALTGEEEGLLGSDYFVHYPTVPLRSIIANVNIDMPMVMFPMNTATGYGAEHSSLEDVIAAAIEVEGFTLAPDPYPEEVIFVRSDQYSFVRQGIPSVYLAEGISSSAPDVDGRATIDAFIDDHYHEPSDDLSRHIEWDTALRFARASARIGYRIAMDERRPDWNDGDFFGEKFDEK
jgi:Zn-dependent M28 family amino/carboxypeptidase